MFQKVFTGSGVLDRKSARETIHFFNKTMKLFSIIELINPHNIKYIAS